MSTDKKSIADKDTKGTGKSAGGKGKGRGGTYLSLGTSLFSGFTAVKKVRAARSDNDALQLVDALLRAAVVTTGIVLLVRELRRADDDSLIG